MIPEFSSNIAVFSSIQTCTCVCVPFQVVALLTAAAETAQASAAEGGKEGREQREGAEGKKPRKVRGAQRSGTAKGEAASVCRHTLMGPAFRGRESGTLRLKKRGNAKAVLISLARPQGAALMVSSRYVIEQI